MWRGNFEAFTVIKVHVLLWYIATVTQRCWTCFVVWVNKAAVQSRVPQLETRPLPTYQE